MKVNRFTSFAMLATIVLIGTASASDQLEYREGVRPPAQHGEVWCLVEVPPQFKTVSEQVCVKPVSCNFEPIPAVYETRTERVCVRPECKREIPIPAEYRN